MKKSLLACLAFALLFVPGCSDDGDSEDGDGPVLSIVVGDEIVGSWTLEELKEVVPFVDLDVDGDTQSGPLLLDVLAVAGLDDWQTAEVLGKGEGRSFDVGLDISASQVDEGWVLDVSNRGTLKLAAEDIPRQEWVRDVAEIRFP